MIVSEAELEQIASRRFRNRLLRLPVRYGTLGERKKCPLRVDGSYELVGRLPYEQYRALACDQPTAARAVLWLIDQCERPVRHMRITVTAVERADDVWLVRFLLGDHRASLDRSRFPAAKAGPPHGDYVSSASRSLAGTSDEVSSSLQDAYAVEAMNGAREARNGLWRDERARLLKAVQEIRLEMAKQGLGSGTARRRLKTVEHNLRALQREVA